MINIDSLTEMKNNEKININSPQISKEINIYFDTINKEKLIRDFKKVGITFEKNLGERNVTS